MLFDNPKSMDFTLKPLENFRCGNHRVKFRVRGERKIDKGELIQYACGEDFRKLEELSNYLDVGDKGI